MLHVHLLDEKKHKELLNEMRKDPVTGELLAAGDEIVFCKSCGSAFQLSSWDYIGEKHCGQSNTLEKIPETKLMKVEWTLRNFVKKLKVDAVRPKNTFIKSMATLVALISAFVYWIESHQFNSFFVFAFFIFVFPAIKKYFYTSNHELTCFENALLLESGHWFWKSKKTLKDRDIHKITILASTHKEGNAQTVSVTTNDGKTQVFEAKWSDFELLSFIDCYGKTVAIDYLTAENNQLHLVAKIKNLHNLLQFRVNPFENDIFKTLPENICTDLGNPIYFSSDRLTPFKNKWSYFVENISFFEKDKDNKILYIFGEVIKSQLFNWLLFFNFMMLADNFFIGILAIFSFIGLISTAYDSLIHSLPIKGLSLYERGLVLHSKGNHFFSAKETTFRYEEIGAFRVIVEKDNVTVCVIDKNGQTYQTKIKNMDNLTARKEFYNTLVSFSHKLTIQFDLKNAYHDQNFLNSLVSMHGARFMLNI